MPGKRWAYLLVAAVLTGPAPVVPVEVVEIDAAPETTDATGAGQPAGGDRLRAGVLVASRESRDVTAVRCADPAAAPGVVRRVLDVALRDCRRRGDLKLQIDVPLKLETVVARCRREHFTYSRTAASDGRVTHEFFADLYTARDAT